MKRALLLLSLLTASVASAVIAQVYKDTGAALTGTTCVSLGSTEGTAGFKLDNVAGFRVIASAPSGQTFTGGSAVCCLYDRTGLGRWMDCDSKMSLTLTSGKRDVPSLDFRTTAGVGRVRYLGSGVTLSGAGTTFDLTYVVSEAAR